VGSTGVDELMVTAMIFDQAARLRSFEILAEIHEGTRGQVSSSATSS
jgi:hypothetical protein